MRLTPSPLVPPVVRQQFFDVQGHRLAALCANESSLDAPIVLLHGITQAHTFWTPALPPSIRRQRRWYAVTLPGHFPAVMPASPSGPLTAQRLADLLAGTLEQLVGEEPVILMGYSTGGFAALNLAAHYPERVRAVASICGFARGTWQGMLGLMQLLARLGPPGQFLFRKLIQLSTFSRPLFGMLLATYAEEPVRARVSPIMREIVQAVYPYVLRHDLFALQRLFADLRAMDIRPMLSKLDRPTLLLGGAEDPVIRPSDQLEMNRLLPDAELHLLENVGHLPFVERTPVYYRILNDWLQRSEARNVLA